MNSYYTKIYTKDNDYFLKNKYILITRNFDHIYNFKYIPIINYKMKF